MSRALDYLRATVLPNSRRGGESIFRMKVFSPLCLAAASTLLAFAAGGAEANHYSSQAPYLDLTLGKNWDLIVVMFVCLAAIAGGVLTLGMPGVGACLRIIIFLPVIEEFLFRYVLTGLIGVEAHGADVVSRWIGISARREELVEALVYFGVIFGLLHLLIACTLGNEFTTVPGLQVCEGLFIGMFNGLIYLNFTYVYGAGLLITMVYLWLAHILINAVLVALNLVVNIVLQGSLLVHLAPRFVLAVTAIFWFVWCWMHNTIRTGVI
jgi:hypothetical protein